MIISAFPDRSTVIVQVFLLKFTDRSVANKAIPLQAWRGPEGSRRLRLPDFKTISTERW